MAIEPIKGFYVHDEATDTDGVAKYDASALANLDDTVNLQGCAPDAKAVGDRLSAIEETANHADELATTLNEGGLELKDDVITGQVDTWLDDHPEATTTVQDGAITKAKINTAFLPEIENAYVTPEMYGYESGNVSSYLSQALNNADKFPVVLGSRNYTLSETVELPEGAKLYGNTGTAFTWSGTTGGIMFTTQALHNKRPHISGIYFNLGTAETALKVYKAGRWGGCVAVNNCRFNGGSGAIIDLNTTFNCYFLNCEFFTQGYIYIHSYDDTQSENITFSNCNTFTNCCYSGSPSSSTKAFKLVNARNTAFYACAVEKTNLAFDLSANSYRTSLFDCWFESVGVLYNGVDYMFMKNCTFTGVTRMNGTSDNVSQYISDGNTDYLWYNGTETDTYKAFYTGNEYTEKSFTGYNPNGGTYASLYKLTSKAQSVRVPSNIRVIYGGAGTTTLSVDLDAFFLDSNIGALYRITGYFYYDDTSSAMVRDTVFEREKSGIVTSPIEQMGKDGWGTAKTATYSHAVAENTIVYSLTTTGTNVRFAYLIVETVPLGGRLKPKGQDE